MDEKMEIRNCSKLKDVKVRRLTALQIDINTRIISSRMLCGPTWYKSGGIMPEDTGTNQGVFGSPTAVVIMACGEILALADSAVLDFNVIVVEHLDNLMQDIAHYCAMKVDEARKFAKNNEIKEPPGTT